jgi:competence protein ComEA
VGDEYRCVPEIIVPSTLRERFGSLGGRRRDSWTVVIVVALAVGLGMLLWRVGTRPQIAPPATSVGVAREPSVQPTPAASATPQGVVLVHVAGAVRRPWLYELGYWARVADAVQAAGGPRRAGDLDTLNLAETLVDGGKVEVPRIGETIASAPATTPAPAASAAAVVDLNQADQAALETIPGIGPVKAVAILEYRAQIGAFSSLEELLDVSGIGPATLESMRPYVTI